MNINQLITRPYLLPLALALASPLAQATAISDAAASLTLDWSSLDSQVVWSDSNFKFNGADANLDGVTDSNYQPGGTGWTGDPTVSFTAQVTADAVGNAHTDLTSANASAHARADGVGTSTPPSEDVSASGTSHRGRDFTPLADGTIVFSFGYQIDHTLSKDAAAESNSVYSLVNLVLKTAAGIELANDQFVLNIAGTGVTGTLGFTVDLLASETYYLEGHVYSSAGASAPEQTSQAVPEPGALAMLGLGLAGMGFARRDKRS
jgi:hypothetical protein